jgi:hypothetical protein
MNYYAGIDVSLECSSVCVVDGAGKIVRESKVASEPGMKKAKVAIARKLAVMGHPKTSSVLGTPTMHRMLVDGTPFIDAA